MSTYTLAQLTAPEGFTAIRARLVTNLNAAGFPVSSWASSDSGDVGNIWLDTVAGHLALYVARLPPLFAAMNLLDFASGDVLKFLATNFYRITPRVKTKTTIWIRLTSTAQSPAYTVTAGQLWFAGLTGNRYNNTTGGTLSPGGTLFVQAAAETAGAAFNDPDLSIDSTQNTGAFVTPLAGVDCLNVTPTDMTPVRLIGDSAGSVSVVFTSPGIAPALYNTIRIRIVTTGDVGSGTWQFSTDNGSTWNAGGPISFTTDIPGGLTVGFRNAPGVSPSFFSGDQFSAQVSTATIANGTDDERDSDLKARCRSRWPGLSDVPTASLIYLWASLASPQVGRMLADADVSVPGQIDLVIAGQNGGIGSAIASDVQDYIQPRLTGYRGLTIAEKILVTPALPLGIVASGTVFVRREILASVQKAALLNWETYLGGLAIGGIVRLSELVQAIMDAGADGADVLAISTAFGAGTPNIQLAKGQVAVPPQDGTSILTSLGWQPT